MPEPKPQKHEMENKFVARCLETLENEGDRQLASPNQLVDACAFYWKNGQKATAQEKAQKP